MQNRGFQTSLPIKKTNWTTANIAEMAADRSTTTHLQGKLLGKHETGFI